jgi:hypothetical protein
MKFEMLILKDSVRQNIIIQAQNILEKNRERMKTDFFWSLLLKKNIHRQRQNDSRI